MLVHLTREFAANAYASRVEVFEKLSTDIEISEKADILICDLRGLLPFYESIIKSLGLLEFLWSKLVFDSGN